MILPCNNHEVDGLIFFQVVITSVATLTMFMSTDLSINKSEFISHRYVDIGLCRWKRKL